MRWKLKRWFGILVLSALLLPGCQGGEWTVGGASDYETFQASVLYSPDPNGGVGLLAMTDSFVPEATENNVAAGPMVQFNLSDVVQQTLDRVIPGDWPDLSNAPTRLYGTLAILWEFENEDLIFIPGTKTVFFPQWRIHPTIWAEYVKPEGGAVMEEDAKILFGAEGRF